MEYAVRFPLGYPVVTAHGACGIVAQEHEGGVVSVDLISGTTVRVLRHELLDYFETTFEEQREVEIKIHQQTQTAILQEKFLLFLRACQEPVPRRELNAIAVEAGIGVPLASSVISSLVVAKRILQSGARGHYRYEVN